MVRRSRTPQGVRGLKPALHGYAFDQPGRTPQGVRGLKPKANRVRVMDALSHSARSAWIETGREKPEDGTI